MEGGINNILWHEMDKKDYKNNYIFDSKNIITFNDKALETYIFKFGCHKGSSAKHVHDTHLSYLYWCCNQPFFKNDLDFLTGNLKNKNNKYKFVD